MARLKRDERICPLCGESIKSVAVRCRYCHADVEAQAEVGPQARSRSKIQRLPGPTEARPDPPVAGPDPEPAGTVRTARAVLRRNVTVVLAGLVVLAAVGVGASWWQAEQSSAVAPNGALVGDEARTQVLVEAADLSQRALSYNYKSLDNDMEVARHA